MKGRLRRGERGQALLELAMVLPVLLLLLFGITEFGQVLGSYLSIQHGAREGVRLAVTGASDQAVVDRVKETATLVDSTRLTVTISPSEGLRYRGNNVTVAVSYPYPVQVPLISELLGSEISLKAKLLMRME